MKYGIGIDLGGTRIKGLAVTPTGRIVAQASAATLDNGTGRWKERVRELKAGLERDVGGPAAWVGVAAPGLAAPDGRSIAFMPGRLPGLEGLNWTKFLKSRRGIPVLNDAHAALVGEHWMGAARNCRNVVLLTLGTGVGGAAIIDGRLLRGQIGRAGHFGHMSLDPLGSPDITRTPGSLEDAIGDCTISMRTGGRFTSTADLIKAVAGGDTAAVKVWETAVRALAAGLCGLINALDPELIVIGGGIARAGGLLFRPLRKALDQIEWRPGGARVRVVRATLGDRAGAFGAARKAMQGGRAL